MGTLIDAVQPVVMMKSLFDQDPKPLLGASFETFGQSILDARNQLNFRIKKNASKHQSLLFETLMVVIQQAVIVETEFEESGRSTVIAYLAISII